MTTTLIVGIVALAGGFVFGVLFGRRNTKKVEASVATVEEVVHRIEAQLKK